VNKFPEFGAELKRDFEVSAGCYDCVEFYDGCNARRADPNSRCLDYFPLPPVGVNGKTGQETPPLRMGDRKEPRIRSATPKPDHAKPRGEATRRIGQSPKQSRTGRRTAMWLRSAAAETGKMLWRLQAPEAERRP
jgi:hypothetical protein